MLCSLSASLMMITRTSRLMATIIFRRDSACASSRFPEGSRFSLVTPSTISATSSPNRSELVDLQRLRGLLQLRLALEVGDRPHVVQPVGKLDDDYPHVAAHGHDHFPQGLGLRLLQVPRGEPLQLGDAVHDLRDLVPEPLRARRSPASPWPSSVASRA